MTHQRIVEHNSPTNRKRPLTNNRLTRSGKLVLKVTGHLVGIVGAIVSVELWVLPLVILWIKTMLGTATADDVINAGMAFMGAYISFPAVIIALIYSGFGISAWLKSSQVNKWIIGLVVLGVILIEMRWPLWLTWILIGLY